MLKIKSKIGKKLLSILLILSFIMPLIEPIKVSAQSVNRIIYTYRSGIGNEDQLQSIYIRIRVVIDSVVISCYHISEGVTSSYRKLNIEEMR